jgi:hypothetical protein
MMGSKRKSDSEQRTARRIVSMVFAFFLTLSLIASIAVIMLQLTVLRPSFMLEQVDASKYTIGIKTDVENTWMSYGMSSGFEATFFEDLMSEDEIRADLFLAVKRLYDPSAPGADIEALEAELHEKMRAYVIEQGEKVSSDVDEVLGYLANICAEAYGKSVSVPLAAQLSSALAKLQKFVLPALGALVIFMIVIVAFLIKIQRFKHRTCIYLIYALTATGLFFVALALAALNTDRFARIGISGQGLYQLYLTYVTNVFNPMLWIGGGMVIISAICALIYLYYKKHV